jgi:hypothetical protein
MTQVKRLALIALPCWILWTALIVAAAPQPPSGVALVVFVASMAAGLAGGVWACWDALAQHATKPWRRAATIALGVVAFAIILFVGHAIGISLALRA